jgi:hypothetical protein
LACAEEEEEGGVEEEEREEGAEEEFAQLMLGPFHRGDWEEWSACVCACVCVCVCCVGAGVEECVSGCEYCMGHPYEFEWAPLSLEEEEEGVVEDREEGLKFV